MINILQGLRRVDKKDFRVVSELVDIPLEKLHVRFIPMAKLENWYEAKDGYNMMSIVNSPHIDLMLIFKEYGLDWARIKKTRYWAERKHRKITQTKWTKAKLIWHIEERYKLFSSIKKYGLKPKGSRKKAVLVTKTPFWCSRYAVEIPGVEGYEVQNGMGRVSAAYVFGMKTIVGKYIEDAKPGSKSWENITKRFK